MNPVLKKAGQPKRPIQVVDATRVLSLSDGEHLGHTTTTAAKRKQMVAMSAREKAEQEAADGANVEHLAKRQALVQKAMNQDITQLRKEVMDVASAKMTKREQHRLHDDKIKAIGGKVKGMPKVPGVQQKQQNKNDLNKAIRYYDQQKELGLADGLVDPRLTHKRQMEEKYDPKQKGLKLHSVGHVAKDGTTLEIGKTAQRKTASTVRQKASGGASNRKLFNGKR